MKDEPSMMLTTYQKDRVHVVAAHGRLDHGVSAEFDRGLELETARAIAQSRHLIVDLSDVPFLSSIILKVIRTQKSRLSPHLLKVALCCPSPVVREILNIAKFDFVAELHDSVDEAAMAIGQT